MDLSKAGASFLDRLAQDVKEALLHDEILVVLPNRRSLFVLRENLEGSPAKLITIDDLMQQLSGLKLIDPEELQVSFFSAYCAHELQAQSFDKFSSWAVTFLGDVNDVDLHLVDLQELFKHIIEYHETGASFDEEGQWGPVEKSFLSFWEKLPGYYQTLIGLLEELKLAYRGLIYRRVAEMAEQNLPALHDYFSRSRVFWVGIIPGNPSERRLMNWMRSGGIKLDLYADTDQYYTHHPVHEAGRLFRAFPFTDDVKWSGDALSSTSKDITVYPMPGQSLQVIRAKALLEEIGRENWPKTVVVLADTSLLIPFVKLMDADKDKINITGGIPMRSTMIHRFVMSWMNLHAMSIEKSGQRYFYHKHLEEFLNHSLVRNWLVGVVDWDAIQTTVVERNMRFVPLAWLQQQMKGDLFAERAHALLFDWKHGASTVFETMSTVLEEWGANTAKLSIARVEQKAMVLYIEKLKLLLSQFNELLPGDDMRSLKQFVHRQVGYSSIYLEEPENNALQVMGMLETRMIDFDRVIVLGASEDFLPGNVHRATHVPFVHRIHFKLPTQRETESLMAYHFYRLITRAKQLHLIYDAVGDEMSGGEPSRYILQLKEELLKVNAGVGWKESGFDFKVKAGDFHTTRLYKTDEVIDDIRKLLRRGLSPSAINTFINSPLEFYYYYVLRLKEQDKVEEDIEASTFGTVVHTVLEAVYLPFEGKIIDCDVLAQVISETDEMVEKEFLKKFVEADLYRGRNLLTLEMAQYYVKSFISFDRNDMLNNGPVKLIKLEELLMTEISLGSEKLRLTGFADRIDERQGKVRIIDYKTGAVSRADLSFDNVSIHVDKKKSKALQLALYKFIYCTNHGLDDEHVDSYIFSFKNFTDGYLPLTIKKGSALVLESMPDILSLLVNDMLDPTQPFEHKADSAYITF